jgi:hypothetical protein
MKRISFGIFPAVLLFPLLCFSVLQDNEAEELKNNTLEFLLKKAAIYCDRLNRSAFDFICLEEVYQQKAMYLDDMWVEKGKDKEADFPVFNKRAPFYPSYLYHQPAIFRKKYVFDYQIIRQDDKIVEKRLPLKKNRSKKNTEDPTPESISFRFEGIYFGPVGLFSKRMQYYHEYRILKEVKKDTQDYIVIEALPKEKRKGHLYGKAWLRKSDGVINYIEWEPKSMPRFNKFRQTAEQLGADPLIKIMTEYNIEKNGIYFPNRFYFEEAYLLKSKKEDKVRRKLIGMTINVAYKNHQFFIVETEVDWDSEP